MLFFILFTIINQYGWEISKDTKTTWRIGDGTAAFYNYIYKAIAGFTEDDDINLLSLRLGDIKVQSLHDNFSGFSIELEFRVKEKKLNQKSWATLNKIAKNCLANN